MSVRVTELPAHHVAYMRYVGPYGAHGIPDLWKKLRQSPPGAFRCELCMPVRPL